MILIIDDDQSIRSSLGFMLKRAGHEVTAVGTPKEALEVVRETAPRLMLMDMNFSLATDGEEGLTLLRQVKLFCPQVPVILMTAWGSIQLAVKGMQAGAFDFVTKPWNNVALMQRIETALELTAGKTDDNTTNADDGEFDRSHIIGRSEGLLRVLEVAKRIAHTTASVLITGESGTGKELIAEAIHRNSPRRGKPFVKVNLGGISQSLFESEMFGHKKGSFTGAVNDRAGRFEMADKGTIFLDEIGELDLSCQVKMLRVLQEQTFERLGESTPRKTDIRVVSATNADLPQMVREGTFREDLFYRINLITVHLPALRERRDDIPLLVRHFIDQQCRQNGLPPVSVTPEAMQYLRTLPYPGNIRELKNLVERTLLVSGNEELTADDFKAMHSLAGQSEAVQTTTPPATEGLTLDEIEKQAIQQAISRYRGNLSLVAVELGISRGALYRRLEKYGIEF
ncbi:MAG: sigma-54-dependent Fis family transcriptional regulator [Bacteroidaceae bacterium]|nr:sigma-54-dependent Fis family transcriptional regulator [Bacteroidaceae bacterium]